jgi:hypothetical protein
MKYSVFLDAKRLFVIVLFASIFTMAVRIPCDSDTFWHLASGRYIVETRSVPCYDTFSHTVTGRPWIDHSWLVQIFFFLLLENFGYAGLSLVVASIVTLAFGFVFIQSDANIYIKGFATVLAAIASAIVWVARPQIFSLLLLALLSLVLHRHRKGYKNKLFLIPPIFLLWANVHGGFVLGFVLLGCYIFGEALESLLKRCEAIRRIFPLVAITMLSLPAILINPSTYRLLLYPFQTLQIPALFAHIQEWKSPDFHRLHIQPFVWISLLAFGALGLSKKRVHLTDLLTISIFFYMSLFAVRNIAPFALVVAPLLARHSEEALLASFPRLLKFLKRKQTLSKQKVQRISLKGAINWILLFLLLSGYAAKVSYSLTSIPATQEEIFPLEAVRFIEEKNLPGEMFNSYNWGGYLIWELYPKYRVFIDGRTHLYREFIKEYLEVIHIKHNWEEVLDRYNVKFVLIETDSILARFLKTQEGWELLYEDEVASIFAIRSP